MESRHKAIFVPLMSLLKQALTFEFHSIFLLIFIHLFIEYSEHSLRESEEKLMFIDLKGLYL